jgi:alpha-glucoside transport system permease protein
MTTQAAELVRPKSSTLAGRIVEFISKTPVHIALIFLAVVWLVPSVGLLITSFRTRSDIANTGWWESLSTLNFTLDNYDQVLGGADMGSSFVNSILISVPATIIPLFIGSLAAFALSWIRFPFRDTIFLAIVALMVVPIQMSLVPVLIFFRNMGDFLANDKALITGSYMGIWLAHSAFALPFCIFLLRNFFITLPRDLIEAARVDGASNFRIFWKVVIPLSVPALASFAIFQFLWVWNDLLMALVFVQESSLLPLTVRISQVQSTYGVEWHLLSAGAFVLMAVPLVVFFSLQRYFVQGLLAGSVK